MRGQAKQMSVKIFIGEIGPEWTIALNEVLRAGGEFEVVGEGSDAVDLLLRINEVHADVVVLRQPAGGREPGICSHLLLEYPNLAVVLLPDEKGCDILRRLMLREEGWGNASKESLRAALNHHRWE